MYKCMTKISTPPPRSLSFPLPLFALLSPFMCCNIRVVYGLAGSYRVVAGMLRWARNFVWSFLLCFLLPRGPYSWQRRSLLEAVSTPRVRGGNLVVLDNGEGYPEERLKGKGGGGVLRKISIKNPPVLSSKIQMYHNLYTKSNTDHPDHNSTIHIQKSAHEESNKVGKGGTPAHKRYG